MENLSVWLQSVTDALMRALADVVDFLPTLAAALLTLLVGWILARAARAAMRRLARDANRMLERTFQRGALAQARLSPAATGALGQIAYWVILFIAVAAAARVLGFAAVSDWLNEIVRRLPNLLVGAAIIGVGYIVSVLVGEQVAQTARAADPGRGALMGRLAQSAVFITTLITGLAQMGVDVTFLIALFSVAVGAIFVGFSIAFGLGAREFVSDIIAARAARRQLKPGASVRIGELEGEILEITPTQIVLDTAEGKALTPARAALSQTIIIRDAVAQPADD